MNNHVSERAFFISAVHATAWHNTRVPSQRVQDDIVCQAGKASFTLFFWVRGRRIAVAGAEERAAGGRHCQSREHRASRTWTVALRDYTAYTYVYIDVRRRRRLCLLRARAKSRRVTYSTLNGVVHPETES